MTDSRNVAGSIEQTFAVHLLSVICYIICDLISGYLFVYFLGIVYSSFAALYSQTRLIFGKYLDAFDVTEKAVVTEENETIVGA